MIGNKNKLTVGNWLTIIGLVMAFLSSGALLARNYIFATKDEVRS